MTDLVNMMGSWTSPYSEREHQPMFDADHLDIINSNGLSVMQREANEIVKAWVSIEDDNEVQAEEALMVLEPDDEDEVVVESGPADADVVMVGLRGQTAIAVRSNKAGSWCFSAGERHGSRRA